MDASSEIPSVAVRPLLITVEQVAELLQVSTRTVWRMRSQGELPAPVRLSGSIRWRMSDIQEWINARCPAQ